MKTLKVIGATIVLALSLSMPAFADGTNPGDGHTPGRPAPVAGDPIPVKTGSGIAIDIDDNDPSFLNIVDILWALASIY